jgi:hypothetical protein
MEVPGNSGDDWKGSKENIDSVSINKYVIRNRFLVVIRIIRTLSKWGTYYYKVERRESLF